MLSLGRCMAAAGSDAGKAIDRCSGEARFAGHLADLKASV